MLIVELQQQVKIVSMIQICLLEDADGKPVKVVPTGDIELVQKIPTNAILNAIGEEHVLIQYLQNHVVLAQHQQET